ASNLVLVAKPPTKPLVKPPSKRDTRAPSRPRKLRKAGGSKKTILLTWKASKDNKAVAGYRLYQGTTRVASTSQTSYLLNGLRCGQQYTLAVAAYAGAGNQSAQTWLRTSTTSW